MTLNEYQEKAMTTCMDSCFNLPYMLFNLQAEVGEISGKVAKLIRKDYLTFGAYNEHMFSDQMAEDLSEDEYTEIENAILEECGDALWQLAGLCDVFGWRLNDVAQSNIDKLASRKERGVIDGSGDNR